LNTFADATLAEVCSLVTDGTHDTPRREADGYPLIKAKEIVGGRIDFDSCDLISEAEHLKVISRSKPEYGDTLFAHIGASLGEAAYVPTSRPFSIKNIALFKPNPEIIDGRYLYYLVISPSFQTVAKAAKTGSAQPFLSLGHLRGHRIRFHKALATQRRIADILSAYDDLIENNQRRIRILEEMARSIYREWFVNFRFPGHEKFSRVESPLGAIPKGWSGHFDDLITIKREGINPSDFAGEEFEHFSIPAFDSGPWPTVEPGETIFSGKYCVDASCVLLSKLNPRIPRVWLPQPTGQRRAITSTEFLVLVPLPGVTREFIYAKCCSHEFRDQFGSLAIGTSTSHQRVKPDNVLSMPTVVPDQSKIARFSSLVGAMLDMIHKLRVKIQNLRQTRDLLLPRLLSGNLNVSDADSPDSPSNDVEMSVEPIAKTQNRSNLVATSTMESPLSEVATQERPGDQLELGYELPPPIDQTDRLDVLAVIRQVFSDGQPRNRPDAIRDVAQALGYGRVDRRIRDALHADLITAFRRGIVENAGGKLRLLTRSIADYEMESLKLHFLRAVGRSWIERDDAIRNFCRWIGFRRTGPIIDEKARSVIQGLLRESRLEADGPNLIRRSS
jgi:type I restriction enzyme S subunit